LVIGSLPGVQNTDNRMTGFEEAAKADPAFSYTFGGYSNNNATTAAQLVASALQKDPDIIGIFAVGELAAEGSATGLRQVGKQSQVTLVDYDAGPQQIAELKDNTVQALIAQHPSTMGEKAVQLGLDALAGKSVEKLATAPVTLVTRANVDTVGQTVQYKSSC
jgi:ribose transport system substrate-binding protein